jgi:Zn-dependent M28 family amino/carboxypeptidase
MIQRWRFGVWAFAILSAVVPFFARQSVRTSSLIDSTVLLNDLKILSADNMEGRLVNSPGGEKARTFVAERFKAAGVEPFGTSYLEPFTFSRRNSNSPAPGVNVIGHIDGTQSPRRYIVVSAHYDHLGVRNGEVFNGADDNASGTAALFAIAKYFSTHKPENSLIFAAFDAEESGDRGSAAWLTSTPVDIASIIADVNMDMIGRDPDPKLFAVGTKANPVLKPVLEEVMSKAPVKLLFGHETPGGQRDTPEEDWSKSSDHYSFQSARIPAIYLGDEDFAQHHKATDKFETMSFDFYVGAVETSLLTVQSFDKHLDEIAKIRGGN